MHYTSLNEDDYTSLNQDDKKKTQRNMNPTRRIRCLIVFIFLVVVLSKASRIHVDERRRSFSSKPSGEDRVFIPSKPTLPVVDAGEILPEKRKVKTGSNPLHNKR
ncbi:PREDICTED: CLAVATA3/ESR (CLE)-related protein 20-like [Camelina sativa]|uniref:CLAVATA3/ESR (CLE)-related protein 20-like n=1 Tax=Camelina sativa TaxID=90675 RepID=A0ABM1R7L6_CAMSA|nr:PREDICTED: CLAVATA3/ESR (CLE)-related protein 20-like [Camelina sativa]